LGTSNKISEKGTSDRKLYDFIALLFPICRSITGNGVRTTLKILSEIIPIQIHEIKSGTKVFDWVIPDEWNIEDGWIKNSRNEKIIDFKKSNLHVLNYSIPIDKKVTLSELSEHIFTIPEFPDWIPYRTSYYNRNWGFCMAHNQFAQLRDEIYHVKIDAKIEPGSMTYGEYFLQGETSDEVLISCHICHPSLCNDNLSGVAVAVYLAKELTAKKRRYSYRFLFIPGTIGSIAWLSLNEHHVNKIKHGLVLTLLGDSQKFNYKKSRRGNTEIDQVVEFLLSRNYDEFGITDFYPYGYDERQYCSPGFNLAVGRLSRSIHGEFPEYHTSADNLDFIKEKNLRESYELVRKIFDTLEKNKTFINKLPHGEPMLGKRNLYSGSGGHFADKDFQMALLWVLNQSDGENSLLNIAKKSGLDFEILYQASLSLQKVGLLDEVQVQS
jgi:aminopeptidase-like protein